MWDAANAIRFNWQGGSVPNTEDIMGIQGLAILAAVSLTLRFSRGGRRIGLGGIVAGCGVARSVIGSLKSEYRLRACGRDCGEGS